MLVGKWNVCAWLTAYCGGFRLWDWSMDEAEESRVRLGTRGDRTPDTKGSRVLIYMFVVLSFCLSIRPFIWVTPE